MPVLPFFAVKSKSYGDFRYLIVHTIDIIYHMYIGSRVFTRFFFSFFSFFLFFFSKSGKEKERRKKKKIRIKWSIKEIFNLRLIKKLGGGGSKRAMVILI